MDALPLAPAAGNEARRRRARPAQSIVNDVHSRLNRTRVRRVLRPHTVGELRDIVRTAAAAGTSLSICGARHSMGGQQFATDTTLIDTTALDRVIDVDGERGLITVCAGITWPRLMTHLAWAFPDAQSSWGIIQKQTGADNLTIGGALSSNIHGRGLRLRPFIGDIESFELVDPAGSLITCSRTINARLFSLAIGGYGLFGAVTRVTLRLARRSKIERRVAIACIDDLPRLFDLRIREGYEYGDFQFATDPASREFLRIGVFSCYRPVPLDVALPDDQRVLSARDWRRLVQLAHTDKSRAFAEYARYYMASDGQIYWSDTHQLGGYPEAYHLDLDRDLHARGPGSEMITEVYVPRESLPDFMAALRADCRQHDVNIIYGTIRVIEQDDESVLSWARERWACIVLNLHVDHTAEGTARAAQDFRRIVDRAIESGGSYYLTYHRWATADQLLKCHPRIIEFLGEKRRFDPNGIYTSDWARQYMSVLAC
jgi:FAD/FMN-containing dehydrogenase